MKWQALALPCLVAATLAGCGGKSDTNNETGAVPGTPADSTSVSTPSATPAPGAGDSAAAPSATPSDSSTSSMSKSDSSMNK